VQRHFELVGVETDREREAGLRIEVDEKHPVPEPGQRDSERVDRRGLRHAALLVRDREDPGHVVAVYEPRSQRTEPVTRM